MASNERQASSSIKLKSDSPSQTRQLSLIMDESKKISASETPQMLLNLSLVLERLIQKNEKRVLPSKKTDAVLTIFHGSRAPDMSIRQYIERIYRYSSCSPSCFIVAYTYMERYFHRAGGHLTALNAHRLLITSIMIAAKFMDDACYNNAYYARIGGVSTDEMNRLELELLFLLDFRLFVTTEAYEKICQQLDKAASEESHNRRSMNRRAH